VLGLVTGFSLFLLRHYYAVMFSTNVEVIEIATKTYTVSAISHVLDFIYGM
jgi:Na+-driven multidrug efflux pump